MSVVDAHHDGRRLDDRQGLVARLETELFHSIVRNRRADNVSSEYFHFNYRVDGTFVNPLYRARKLIPRAQRKVRSFSYHHFCRLDDLLSP